MHAQSIGRKEVIDDNCIRTGTFPSFHSILLAYNFELERTSPAVYVPRWLEKAIPSTRFSRVGNFCRPESFLVACSARRRWECQELIPRKRGVDHWESRSRVISYGVLQMESQIFSTLAGVHDFEMDPTVQQPEQLLSFIFDAINLLPISFRMQIFCIQFQATIFTRQFSKPIAA